MHYLELYRVVERLSFDLQDARLEQICDGENRLQLTFKRSEDEERRRFFIVIDFLSTHLDLYPTTHPRKAPPVPQVFTMLLRKYVLNHALVGLHLADDDRIVTFEFGFDGASFYALIVELTGRNPHLFFVDVATREILGRVGEADSREIHGIYAPPAPHLTRDVEDRFESVGDGDLYSTLDGAFQARDEGDRVALLQKQTIKRLERARSRAAKLVSSLTRDLDKAESAELARKEADLLNAYAWKLRQGETPVTLPDFETNEPVCIALDPAISVRENIARRYAFSSRMRRSREQIRSRLALAQTRQATLERLLALIATAKDASPILENRETIDALCGVSDEQAPKASRQAPKIAAHKPYKTFQSADGTPIWVGKSAKDNDDLTFHHTRGNEWWLHVSGLPGSHVVVKSTEPSQETLRDAALLAMHYSKYAHAERAEVHVTQCKYVRKPKGAPDGKVEIRGERAIVACASEKRLARLMATER